MFNNIIVNRGYIYDDSYMITEKIINIIKPYNNYKIKKNNLEYINNLSNINNLEFLQKNKINIPLFVKFYADWNFDNLKYTENSNILGKNGTLLFNDSYIDIPIVEATNEYLNFYNCKLYKLNDIINFNINVQMPVTIMNIGKKYISNFIMNENQGGGVYLEYHDLPHFHMPLSEDSTGYLLLGKKNNNNILLTAFKIPYNYGIYTSSNVIHCDSFLVGKYLVIYSKTENYSTVICRNKYTKKLINFNFI